MLTHQQTTPSLLIVVFIHGFKGTDTTFGDFPQRLQHVLAESLPGCVAECVVFPAYETKGDLTEAIARFADWLTTFVVNREVAHGEGGGAGKAHVVLCGHSMGGLLAADALLGFASSRPDRDAPLWPKVVACIAFDTPFLGIDPAVFRNTAAQALEYAAQARTAAAGVLGAFSGRGRARVGAWGQRALTTGTSPSTPSPTPAPRGWGAAALAVGGALLASTAAGAAYQKRADLTSGYGWITDHLKYVGHLWDETALKRRVERLVGVEKECGVVFRNLYTSIPPSPPRQRTERTFVLLPPHGSSISAHFVPASNTLASDEIQAHTGMFGAATNDGYYQLGLETARLIREAVAGGAP